ncbi:hypothetical protein FRZ61_44620 [Hypericibacter adhaerens]|uniref:Uncharacterized protein n=1 Tax=Hypericibacter adhaerens TaxID=2602016 RepID=A0A5J6N3V7_9PROT|nr:hypothetical protein FRZ61_44620 [Hypericibacter adhaerens]
MVVVLMGQSGVAVRAQGKIGNVHGLVREARVDGRSHAATTAARRHPGVEKNAPYTVTPAFTVTPAKAGVHFSARRVGSRWAPAFAGVTTEKEAGRGRVAHNR